MLWVIGTMKEASMHGTIASTRDLAARYVALWNETDAAARRAAIAALWRPDGWHFIKEREVHGYAALEQRVTGSHEKNVRDNRNRFRACADVQRLRDVVTFSWQMVPAGADTVPAVGREFLVLDAEDRIIADYQFIIN
jgi:hypothetical protein